MLAISLLLALLSWRFLERMHLPATSGRRMALLLCLPLALAVALHLHERARHVEAQSPLRHAVLIHHPQPETDPAVLCGLEQLPQLGLMGKPLRLGSGEAAPEFLFIGDSHAQHLYDALHEACLSAGLRGIYLNNTVSPYHGLIQPQVGADTCQWNPEIEQLLLNYLDNHPGITRVLIAQCWQMRMTEGFALEGSTGRALSGKRERGAVTSAGLGIFCDLIRRRGRQPVLLGETPRFSLPYPQEEWHRRALLGVAQRERQMSASEFEERHAFPLSTLRGLAQAGRAQLIELTPALRIGNAYPARHSGEFWYYDANHLTPVAARRVVQLILPRLAEKP